VTKASPVEASVLRFGRYEIDVNAGELRRAGRVVRLQPQPFRLLTFLATHAGQLVTREAMRQQLWGGETFVDFEQGENHCVRQIRTALGDDARKPRYIETLPRRGYRFIARVDAQAPSVDTNEAPPVEATVEPAVERTPAPVAVDPAERPAWPGRWRLTARFSMVALMSALIIACALAVTGTSGLGRLDDGPGTGPKLRVAVMRFTDLTRDSPFARGLTQEIATELTRETPASLEVISVLATHGSRGTPPNMPDLVRSLDVDYLLGGSVLRAGGQVRITAQLIEARSLTLVWVESYQHPAQDMLGLQAALAEKIIARVMERLGSVAAKRSAPVEDRAPS